MSSHDPKTVTARPDSTTALTVRTGREDHILSDLGYCFCAKVRANEVLGPTCEARNSNRAAHFGRWLAIFRETALQVCTPAVDERLADMIEQARSAMMTEAST